VAEQWVSDNLGPEARLARAAEGVSALGKLAEDLPQLVRNAEQLSQMVAEGGVRLHPETSREIAWEQNRKGRPLRVVLIALLAVIAVALLMRWQGAL
jgi:ubiquinone biosynthesis protein